MKKYLQQPEDSPRLATLTSKCQTLDWIRFNLCDLKATAGVILRHAIAVIQSLFQAEEPLIFKIGFTHNPIWRWTNDIYGYCKARERWSAMIILHYSREPYTAAMLEAALIEKFQSNSVLIGGCFLFLAILGAPRFRHIFLQPSNQTKAGKDVRMSEQAVTQSTQKSQLQTADL